VSIPITEQKILQIRSGNTCAFPACRAVLVERKAFGTRPVILGEIAHIVSASPDGPRGGHYLPPGEHDKHTNLIFLCPEHHKIIDDEPHAYTVERLRQMKKEHEEAVEKALAHVKERDQPPAELPLIRESVHSTLLPVLKMPRLVFGGPCKFGDSQEKEAAQNVLLSETEHLCPFIIRDGGTLFAFNDLRRADSPFRNVVETKKAKKFRATTWWDHPDKSRWHISLLNRTLNKLTGRKGLMLDREHRRYFFPADAPGQEKSVEYRPLNQGALVGRKVVWRPTRKKTGEPRPFWNHLAVSLRFEHAGNGKWCLCLRPELRVTKDGIIPITSKETGSRVTSQKAHMFNYDLLGDVNFWRDYLSGGRPRIMLRFGGGHGIIISTTLMASEVDWPGIPKEYALPFTNIDYEEDLFSAIELEEIESADDEEDAENGIDESADE
jgi:hypothetical protein